MGYVQFCYKFCETSVGWMIACLHIFRVGKIFVAAFLPCFDKNIYYFLYTVWSLII